MVENEVQTCLNLVVSYFVSTPGTSQCRTVRRAAGAMCTVMNRVYQQINSIHNIYRYLDNTIFALDQSEGDWHTPRCRNALGPLGAGHVQGEGVVQ